MDRSGPTLNSTSSHSLKTSLLLMGWFKTEPESEPESTLKSTLIRSYPSKQTHFFEYLGRYSPEPIWNRLSPFDRQGLLHRYNPRMDPYLRRGERVEGFVPGNPFLWGIRIVGMETKTFFEHLPENIKKKLRQGSYKAIVQTKTTESTEPFRLVNVKVTLKEGSGSITFDWDKVLDEKFKFAWGNPLYVDIWILIRRIPLIYNASKFRMDIVFFIEEPLTNLEYSIPKHISAIRDAKQEWKEIGRKYSLARPNVVTPEMVEKEFIPHLCVHFMYPFIEKVLKYWGCGDEQRTNPITIDYCNYSGYSDEGFLEWRNQEPFNSKYKEMKVENWSECSASQVASSEGKKIYSAFSESVQRMPSKLNQWRLVAREEPDYIKFARCSELTNQKAYSAFATKIEADKEILEILELYRQIFEEILAVPIIKGKVSELKKLADGLYTATVEVFIPNCRRRLPYMGNAWGIRGATAENALGWVNSWSCSIRAIEIMKMVHRDGRGLVFPPKVAPVQVIVSSGFKKSDRVFHDAFYRIVDALCRAGIRAKTDLYINDSDVTGSMNYYRLPDEFEMISTDCVRKGVPLLIKVGSENDQLLALRRDKYEKVNLLRDSVSERVKEILDDIQTNLFEAAKSRQEACIRTVTNWDEFVEVFKVDSAKIVLAPWCDDEEVEKNVKSHIDFDRFGLEVKILCSPLEQPDIPEGNQRSGATGDKVTRRDLWKLYSESIVFCVLESMN